MSNKELSIIFFLWTAFKRQLCISYFICWSSGWNCSLDRSLAIWTEQYASNIWCCTLPVHRIFILKYMRVWPVILYLTYLRGHKSGYWGHFKELRTRNWPQVKNYGPIRNRFRDQEVSYQLSKSLYKYRVSKMSRKTLNDCKFIHFYSFFHRSFLCRTLMGIS